MTCVWIFLSFICIVCGSDSGDSVKSITMTSKLPLRFRQAETSYGISNEDRASQDDDMMQDNDEILVSMTHENSASTPEDNVGLRNTAEQPSALGNVDDPLEPIEGQPWSSIPEKDLYEILKMESDSPLLENPDWDDLFGSDAISEASGATASSQN